ncbi:hypothetical protein NPIL_526321 [Nephila pilipes]|uniref:Uncharacterized protein n=1 Tax=Nephila pilipes TaxID=299642 RepID=A0A8X6PW19_NEPPI|nr:hypothetical protein NPIL_526321 [Nephila pilipes]
MHPLRGKESKQNRLGEKEVGRLTADSFIRPSPLHPSSDQRNNIFLEQGFHMFECELRSDLSSLRRVQNNWCKNISRNVRGGFHPNGSNEGTVTMTEMLEAAFLFVQLTFEM